MRGNRTGWWLACLLWPVVALAEVTPTAVDPVQVQQLNDAALAAHEAERYAEAADLYQTLLPLVEAHFGAQSTEAGRVLASLADTQAGRGQYEAAAGTYEQALQRLTAEDGRRDRAAALNGLASALYMRRHYREAEPLYLEALSLLEGQVDGTPPEKQLVLENLVALNQTLGRDRQARLYQARLRALLRDAGAQ